MSNKRVRMIVVLIVSFFSSSLIANRLFVAGTPIIDENSKLAIFNFPQTSTQIVSQILTANYQPPPTITPARPINQPTLVPDPKPTAIRQSPIVLPTVGVTTIILPSIITHITPVEQPTDYPEESRPEIPQSSPTPAGQSNATMAEFGQCLTRNGMVMYTQPGCSACTQQKKILGDALKYVTEVVCPQKPEECSSAGVRATPSWGKNGKIVIPGGTSLEYIAQVSGCQLPN